MDDLIRQATCTLRAMWKHRWLGLGVAWVVAGISALVVLHIPDKYKAEARIYVDTQSILKPLMTGLAVQPNVEQQIAMLSRTLISRPNVEKLIRMADLDPGGKSRADQDESVDRVMKNLEIKSTSRDKLYTIAYRDPDPARAERVVQSLVSIFIESSRGDTRQDSDSAKKFIDDQIKVYEKKLIEAEERLKQFKLRYVDVRSIDGKSSTDRLAEISADLEKARLQLREAENSRDALKRQIAGEEPVQAMEVAGAESSIAVPEIDSRIEAQKRNLDNLLQRYTEQHPDVAGTRRLLKSLEEQRQEIAARRKLAGSSPGVVATSNPVYQQLKISLAEVEADVASLRTRVGEYEARYRRIRELMNTAPQIEAEYAQLNRDYDIHKKNYEGLVARRESASLSSELESVAGADDFRLIDPPRASPRPVAPNRLLLLPFALMFSLGAGMFSSFAVSQLRPVFFDSRSLREVTGLPLLGCVSLVGSESRREKEKAELKRFLLLFGALVGAYVIGMIVLFVQSRNAV